MLLGFGRCPAAPCFYFHREREIYLEVHQDDWYAAAEKEQLNWFATEMGKHISTKTSVAMKYNCRYAHPKQGRVRTKEGMFVHSNRKYSKEILKSLKMEDCNPKPTPITSAVSPDDILSGLLDPDRAFIFRHCTGVARFMTTHRSDLLSTARELSKRMKEPTENDWKRLIRMARYLKGSDDLCMFMPREGKLDVLDMRSDTDWAGDKLTRKSTACGIIEAAGCPQVEYSRGQDVEALFSGEAEYFGGLSATSEGLMVWEVFAFFGFPLKMRLHLDSSAAKAVSQRLGAGRIRHLEVRTLWLQRLVKLKQVQVLKELGERNPADIGTKVLAEKKFLQLRELVGLRSINPELMKLEEAPVVVRAINVDANAATSVEGRDEVIHFDDEVVSKTVQLVKLMGQIWKALR